MKNIIKLIINLAIGLSGLGIIIHLAQKNEELNIQRASAEASTEFWKSAFRSESRLRIEHAFDLVGWRLLYKKYGWGGNPNFFDKATTERLMKEDDEEDEAEDLTNLKKE